MPAGRLADWPTDCILWQGVRWYLYFTSSPEAAEEYVNGTGLGAGEAGRQRAALAREWAQYLKYLGPNQGYEPAKDLRWWPTPGNPSVSPAEFQLFVMYAFAGPAVAELSYELTCQFPWYAADLGETVYPNPGLCERPANSKGVPYPRYEVQGYGEVPFPKGDIRISDPDILRDQITQQSRIEFRAWWCTRYGWYPAPNEHQIHHVQPLSRGGTNDFDNLVPVRIGPNHQAFTNWWRYYP